MNYEEQYLSEDEQLKEVEKQLLEQHKKRKRPLWRRIARFLFRIVMVLLLLLLVVIPFIISYPSVQNRLVDWAADVLSEKLKTEVSIDYVNFSFFDRFLIKDFLVRDLDGDTLVFSETVQIDVDLFSLLGQQTIVDNIYIKNAHFKIIAPKGNHLSNIQFLFDTFFPPGPEEPPTPEKPFPWNLDIKKLTLENVSYTNLNHYIGVLMGYRIDNGLITFEKFDLKKKEIAINEAVIRGVNGFHHLDTMRLKVPENAVILPDTFPKGQYVDTFSRTPLLLTANRVRIKDSRFQFDNDLFDNSWGEKNINYQHMLFEDIQIDIANVKFFKQTFTGHLAHLSLKESKGMVIKKIYGDLRIGEEKAELADMKIITERSEIGDYLAFNYKSINDFQDFNNKVKLDLSLVDAKIAFKDLLALAPPLQYNAFFSKNEKEIILVSGNAKNAVNRLRAKDVDMIIGKNTRIKGDFSSNNITRPQEAFMNLKLASFSSHVNTIQLLFKDTKFPEEIMRLGKLSFEGRLDGFLQDFVASGNLKTDLGTANCDWLRMNLKSGREYGSYSGKFGLKNFQLGKWLEKEDIGIVNFSSDVKGKGFTLQDVKAEIKASIQDFTYKGYKYTGVAIDGLFEKQLFDGKLAVRDDNIDLVFDGKVDLNDTLPEFDLSSTFNYINLKPLNLVNLDYELSGNINLDFIGDNPNNIKGKGILSNFRVISKDTVYSLNSLEVESGIDANNARFYDVKSELVSGKLTSNFDFIKVQDVLLHYFTSYYPSFTTALGLKMLIKKDSNFVYVPTDPAANEYYSLNCKVNDTKNWLNLFAKNIAPIKDLDIKSRFDSRINLPSRKPNEDSKITSRFNFDLNFPNIGFNNVKIGNSLFKMQAIGDQCDVNAYVSNTLLGDSLKIPYISVINKIEGDQLNFRVNGKEIGNVVKKLKFEGAIKAIGNQIFRINIDTSDVVIFNREWSISQGNQLTLYKTRLVPENLTLTQVQNNETIQIDSLGAKGLKLKAKNISLDWLKEFVQIKNMDFKGRLNATVEIENLFKAKNFQIQTTVDSLKLNEFYLGKLDANINLQDVFSPINIHANIRKDASKLGIIGSYTSPTIATNFKNDHYFNFKVEARDYPLQIIEQFVGHFISNTKGIFNADILVMGTPSQPELTGNVRLSKVGVMIDYLQTYYRMDRATVKVTNDEFRVEGIELKEINGDITKGCILQDRFNHQAFVQGGVTHNRLKDFNFNINIETPKFLFLDTKKEDNELFYGTAIGDASVNIKGPLNQPEIEVTATSDKGTEIVLPIIYSTSSSAVSFINFINKDTAATANQRKYVTPVGLDLTMNLNVTEDTKMRLIFDEQVGDEIKGIGNGKLQMDISRTGEFTMRGIYTIQEGEYLFTYKDLGINKPFEVREGGTITWTGDPLTADLNLNAYYRNLKARPYNLILEYLTDADKQYAKRNTKVDLEMNLRGDLFSPNISFGLDLPDVDNNIKPFVENKLKILQEEEGELNRQVFGLVVLGDFLPSNFNSTGTDLVNSVVVNTFTEMLSNQLSIYVTDLVTEALGDNSFVNNLDVNVNIRRDNGQLVDDPTSFNNQTAYELGLSNSLFNDRLTISGVVNYIDNGADGNGQYTSDFELELSLTKDARWRLKGYNRNELFLDDLRNKSGLGISYERDFDTLSELDLSLKEMFKTLFNKQPQ
jgi:hypothetical protein